MSSSFLIDQSLGDWWVFKFWWEKERNTTFYPLFSLIIASAQSLKATYYKNDIFALKELGLLYLGFRLGI